MGLPLCWWKTIVNQYSPKSRTETSIKLLKALLCLLLAHSGPSDQQIVRSIPGAEVAEGHKELNPRHCLSAVYRRSWVQVSTKASIVKITNQPPVVYRF